MQDQCVGATRGVKIALRRTFDDLFPLRSRDRGQDSRPLVLSCSHFRREVVGVEAPRGIHAHIAGIDLVRDSRSGERYLGHSYCGRPWPPPWLTHSGLVEYRSSAPEHQEPGRRAPR
jgi:A circularly permuted ATPgrasp